jgi:hypothetical protein
MDLQISSTHTTKALNFLQTENAHPRPPGKTQVDGHGGQEGGPCPIQNSWWVNASMWQKRNSKVATSIKRCKITPPESGQTKKGLQQIAQNRNK